MGRHSVEEKTQHAFMYNTIPILFQCVCVKGKERNKAKNLILISKLLCDKWIFSSNFSVF